MYKYIAFDLDGTLLDRNKKIDLETLEYLNSIHHDYIFLFCTSRHIDETLEYSRLLNFSERDFIICDDGYCIYCGNGNLLFTTLSFLKSDIIKISKTIGAKEFDIYSADCDLLIRNNEAKNVFRNIKSKLTNGRICRRKYFYMTFNQVALTPLSGYYKINIKKTSKTSLSNDVNKIDGNFYIREYNNYLEALSCNKYIALKQLEGNNKITLDKLIYFGDDLNDLECFENIKVSIAKKHSPEILKKYAYKTIDEGSISNTLKELMKK